MVRPYLAEKVEVMADITPLVDKLVSLAERAVRAENKALNTQQILHELITTVRAGGKIQMIKLVRQLTDLGLKESKDLVDAACAAGDKQAEERRVSDEKHRQRLAVESAAKRR
jgi:ribosomal protein L7/L12